MLISNITNKLPHRSEHEEQVTLFEWAAIQSYAQPELALMRAIPNGGHRDIRVARKLKDEGVKAGTFDILLPVARIGYHGLWIEMKVGKNTLTKEQRQFMVDMETQGYRCSVCYSWEAAADELLLYLAGDRR